MRDHLEKLAAHIENLDSGSKDAKAIRWGLAEIDRRTEAAATVAEREVVLDAMRGHPGVRPYGREIAAEIRSQVHQ